VTQDAVEEYPSEADFAYPPAADQRPSWVFVSHSAADYAAVRKPLRSFDGPPRFLTLHIANRAQGPAFVEAYKPRILRSLSRCGWFVVVVSQASIRSVEVGAVRGHVGHAQQGTGVHHVLDT
jgi:hypothetical protein